MAFILKQKNKNGSVNVYYTSSNRVPGKNYPVQSRKYLGKLDEANNELLKNRKLSSLNRDELEALRKKGIKYTGRECPAPGRTPKRNRKIPDYQIREWRSLEYGRVWALRHLAEESGVLDSLRHSFGESDAMRIFALAVFECVENSALYRAENWIRDTTLAEEADMSKSTIGRAVSNIGADGMGRSLFFREWIRRRGFPKVLIHDTTSISSYAEKISMIEYGYNRDSERLPQLNFSLVYTAKDQLPLVYRLIPGSIPDVSTLTGTSRLLEEYGLKQFTYALDRGYYSKGNLLYMLENKIQFTIGVPLFISNMKKLLKKHDAELGKIQSGLLVGDKTYRYAKDVLELKKDGAKGRPYKLGVHIFINRQRRSAMINELDSILLSALEQFQKESFHSREEAMEWCEEKFPRQSGLFSLSGRRADKLKLSISEEAYAEKTKNYGTFIVLNSDAKEEGVSTLFSNKHRDAVEKIFDILKNSTPNKRLRVASDLNAEGKMFIGFIAVILHTLLENKLRKHDMLNTYTVNQTLDLLRKIRMGITPVGQKVLQEIPSKTRKMLAALNWNIPKL